MGLACNIGQHVRFWYSSLCVNVCTSSMYNYVSGMVTGLNVVLGPHLLHLLHVYKQRRLSGDCASAQSQLSLRCSHMLHGTVTESHELVEFDDLNLEYF